VTLMTPLPEEPTTALGRAKRNRSLPERLDDLANLTGFPQWSARITDSMQHRHLRVLPIVALVTATGGLIAGFVRPDLFLLGYMVMFIGNSIGSLLPLFGPVKPWGTTRGVDERDRQVRRDAYFVTFATISIVAVIGMLALIGVALVEDWKSVMLMGEMGLLVFYLFSLWEIVPTLHASWATRPIEDE
jgi:hypothetical protein